MAWLDERIWCHPKLAAVPKSSRWIYVAGIAYSSGFGTEGSLSASQQKLIGGDAKDRRVLIESGVWEDAGAGAIRIHDWHDHNADRDEKRRQARERKRRQRARQSQDNGRDSHTTSHAHVTRDTERDNAVTSRVTSRARAMKGEEVKSEEVKSEEPRAVRTENHDDEPDLQPRTAAHSTNEQPFGFHTVETLVDQSLAEARAATA